MRPEYTRQTLVKRGVAAEKILRMHFPVANSFRPRSTVEDDGIFRIVFLGSATVMKGLPLLLDAIDRADLDPQRTELTIVGGPASRGMRRYLDQRMTRSPHITLAPGDPLPHLHRASVLAHPSWEDGWAYAPAEALACGVPIIVTRDTGMSEIVRPGVDGQIVPTGDIDAFAHALSHARRDPLVFTPPAGLWGAPHCDELHAPSPSAASGVDPVPDPRTEVLAGA